METQPVFELAPIFQAAQSVMQENRLAFNQADSVNANHGDHMVEVFAVAVQAAQDKQAAGLAEAMDYAGDLLCALPENGSAQVYARGLASLGEQFRKYNITLEELAPYIRKVLKEEKEAAGEGGSSARSGDVLKALVSALASWQQREDGRDKPANPLDLGYMFDLGIAYMQAKQRGGSRAEVIADAAVSVSPLSQVPHRGQSGKAAILALLQAMAKLN